MRLIKLVMMVLLGLSIALPATAEWTVVGKSENLTLYADFTSISKTGSRVKMWGLYDYETPQWAGDKSHMSMVEQTIYDCDERQTQTGYFTN